MLSCKFCGKSFDSKGKKHAQYCSEACFHASRRIEPVERICPTCSKPFYLLPCHAKHRVYCSRECWRNRPLKSPEERLWESVEKTDGCWIWHGYTSPAGYGQIGIGNKLEFTHRLSWEIANGPIPDGMVICHHCDNPACVRPDHLFLGTLADNNHDMKLKGRIRNAGTLGLNYGEANGNSRLTREDVIAMRSAYDSEGKTFTDIANEYNVSISTASRIVQRVSWKHVP